MREPASGSADVVTSRTSSTFGVARSSLNVSSRGASDIDGLGLAAIVGDLKLDLFLLLQAAEALTARRLRYDAHRNKMLALTHGWQSGEQKCLHPRSLA